MVPNTDGRFDAARVRAYVVSADKLSLDARNGLITALEPAEMGAANAVRICLVLFAGSGPINGTVYLQAGNDRANYTAVGNVALNGLGVYSFQVSGIACAHIRLFFVIASGGTSSYTCAADMSLAKL
ncbi:MAG: hypothetical protein HYY18_08430 [Planctomycetes bacterium]|nr:hypothetical protein [Planctomycetota bacterium]